MQPSKNRPLLLILSLLILFALVMSAVFVAVLQYLSMHRLLSMRPPEAQMEAEI